MPNVLPHLPTGVLASVDLPSYLPIFVVVLLAVNFAIINLVGTLLIGPKRGGKTKGASYESGMNAIGTARKRFNVRFYLIAMTFLVFDVEIIFLFPWAATFSNLRPMSEEGLVWLGRIGFFMFTTIVMYLYGRRKGVFNFD
jgi:NADH-quinone oxidoreductase subunit A